MRNICAKWIGVAALGYAIYLVYYCPCDQLVVCHSEPFYISLGIAALTPTIAEIIKPYLP